MKPEQMQAELAKHGIPTMRTGRQNNALHKWCELAAECLDGAGIDMRELIRVPIRPNKENFKSEIWHPVMKAINPNLKSTAEMTTKETIEVYETLVRAFGERKGITLPPWPSDEPPMIGE